MLVPPRGSISHSAGSDIPAYEETNQEAKDATAHVSRDPCSGAVSRSHHEAHEPRPNHSSRVTSAQSTGGVARVRHDHADVGTNGPPGFEAGDTGLCDAGRRSTARWGRSANWRSPTSTCDARRQTSTDRTTHPSPGRGNGRSRFPPRHTTVPSRSTAQAAPTLSTRRPSSASACDVMW